MGAHSSDPTGHRPYCLRVHGVVEIWFFFFLNLISNLWCIYAIDPSLGVKLNFTYKHRLKKKKNISHYLFSLPTSQSNDYFPPTHLICGTNLSQSKYLILATKMEKKNNANNKRLIDNDFRVFYKTVKN